MAYKVIKEFKDLHDGNHHYKVGSTYPRRGYKPHENRLIELASSDNRQGEPLIKEEKKKTTKKKAAKK